MSRLKRVTVVLFLCCNFCLATGKTSVPFELVNGLVYVQTSVNGSTPLPFVFDTGASYSILSPETAESLGIETSGSLASDGPGRGGDPTMKTAQGVTLRVDKVELKNQKIAVLPVDYIEKQAGHPTAGILSAAAFAERVVQVDYGAQIVRFLGPSYTPSADDYEVPITLRENVPFVEAEVGLPNHKSIRGSFICDSGFVGAILFSRPLLTRYPETLQLENRVDLPAVEAVGGAMQLQAVQVSYLRLGTIRIAKPLAILSLNGAGVLDEPNIDGIIGTDVLQRFRVTYDYSRNRIIFTPGRVPVAASQSQTK